MSEWRAVIFDLDDTLYLERDFVRSGMSAVASWAERRLGIPADQAFRELKTLFEQGVRGNTFNLFLEANGRSAQRWLSAMVKVYREHQPVLDPFPEVPALLTSLQQRCRLALLGDGDLEMQRRKLAALGVEEYFDVVLFADEIGRHAWKPSPEPFCVALERLGKLAPVDVVYVADNPLKDFIGARQAGILSIRIQHPLGVYSALQPSTPEHAPDVTIRSLEQLEVHLHELAKRTWPERSSMRLQPRSSS